MRRESSEADAARWRFTCQGCIFTLKGSMGVLGKALIGFESSRALLGCGGYCATSSDRTVGGSRWIYSQQEAMLSLSGISRGLTSRGRAFN